MEDNLIPKFRKYYVWCCPNRDNSFVESITDCEKPASKRHDSTNKE